MRDLGFRAEEGRGHRGTAALTGGGGRERVRMAPRAGPPRRRGDFRDAAYSAPRSLSAVALCDCWMGRQPPGRGHSA
jgi:hypothetical protein